MTLPPDAAARISAALASAMVNVMRPLATALQTTAADVWRNPAALGGKTGAPALHHADILVAIATPDARGLQRLSDLGALKANMIGSAAWNEDILEGDELHVGDTIYQVERVTRAADATLLALWEINA